MSHMWCCVSLDVGYVTHVIFCLLLEMYIVRIGSEVVFFIQGMFQRNMFWSICWRTWDFLYSTTWAQKMSVSKHQYVLYHLLVQLWGIMYPTRKLPIYSTFLYEFCVTKLFFILFYFFVIYLILTFFKKSFQFISDDFAELYMFVWP